MFTFLLANSVGAMYLVDLGVYLPPNATTVDPLNPDADDYRIRYLNPEFLPNLRFWYRDPLFNSPETSHLERLMRLTDSESLGVTAVTHEYSSVTPFNENRTKIVVSHEGFVAVYDLATYDYQLVGALSHALPRWSRTSENILYYWPFVDGGDVQLYQYDASTGMTSTVGAAWSFNGHTYDRTYNNAGEDDICFGGDHLVRVVGWTDRVFLVIFSIKARAVVAEYDITGLAVNSVEIAPAADALGRANDKRDMLIVGFDINEERPPDPFGEFGKGMWAFRFDENASISRRISPFQQINTSLAHHDLGLDSDGSPIMVVTNSATFNPVAGCQTPGHGIEKIPLADPDSVNRSTSTCVLTGIPWSLGEHITLADQRGWFFVSLSAPDDPVPGEPEWEVFTNELLQVRLDGSRQMRRLAHHRSRPSTDGYRWQPKLSASRDGKSLAFTSNFGYGVQPGEYTDVYLVGNVDVRDGTEYTLGIVKQGSGDGVVVSRPSGVYCGQQCSTSFREGSRITLTAVPGPGSTFAGWRGGCIGENCTVQMNRSRTVTAVFNSEF